MTESPESTLAKRLGVTVHVSPLRIRLRTFQSAWPSADAACIEDWLLDVANAREARVVVRGHEQDITFAAPPLDVLPNEELVVAICQLQSLDRPQMLRVAAQLISRQVVSGQRLISLARQERAELVLGAMARQALRVDPDHPMWRHLAESFRHTPVARDPIIHWTRMSVPVPTARGCNAASWRLVA
jgi:hypothetical protein